MDNLNKDKEGSFAPVIFIMFVSLIIAFCWNSVPILKNTIHSVLDPSAGVLLNWNLLYGMLIVVFIITLITTFVQKYGTDQKTLRELRDEQKKVQKEMKEYRDDPAKIMELQKSMWPTTIRIMKISMRSIIYTGIPFILFFRWFMDYFTAIGNPKVFWFLSWFWFYLIFAMIFSSILRKVLKVV